MRCGWDAGSEERGPDDSGLLAVGEGQQRSMLPPGLPVLRGGV